ncbi:MAG: type II toxin-antitoxin system CcdA family antitoxin [Alphaproteobacteria bacterium]|nr:type II toxin-antitoxin system CcdA family antitoxin [Alphaproteobacteria bacterium]
MTMKSSETEAEDVAGAGRSKTPEQDSRRWQEDNRAALLSSNDYVARHGLPLARFRQF